MVRTILEQAALPEVAASPHLSQHATRKAHFQSLHDRRRASLLRFAYQEMNMFGHHYVPRTTN
jgi:hypothetical protein